MICRCWDGPLAKATLNREPHKVCTYVFFVFLVNMCTGVLINTYLLSFLILGFRIFLSVLFDWKWESVLWSTSAKLGSRLEMRAGSFTILSMAFMFVFSFFNLFFFRIWLDLVAWRVDHVCICENLLDYFSFFFFFWKIEM